MPELDIESIIAAARITEKTVSLCLRGDLVAEHETAVAALNAVTARLADVDDDALTGSAHADARTLAERVQQIEGEMTDSTVTFRFRALAPAEWAALKKQHETPEGGLDDAFMPAVAVRCCVEPAMTAEQFARLRERLSDAQDDLILGSAWAVNRGTVDVPKSLAASATLAMPGSSPS